MNPVQDSAKSAKQIAIDTAKKVAREPLEILKDAPDQIFGDLENNNRGDAQDNIPDGQYASHATRLDESVDKEEIKKDDLARIAALEREISQIRNDELYKKLIKRVQEGEIISVVDYPELSFEQKQVLIAQMEAVKMRMGMADKSEVVPPSSKPSRRFLGGGRLAAQRQTTRIEKPTPPSG